MKRTLIILAIAAAAITAALAALLPESTLERELRLASSAEREGDTAAAHAHYSRAAAVRDERRALLGLVRTGVRLGVGREAIESYYEKVAGMLNAAERAEALLDRGDLLVSLRDDEGLDKLAAEAEAAGMTASVHALRARAGLVRLLRKLADCEKLVPSGSGLLPATSLAAVREAARKLPASYARRSELDAAILEADALSQRALDLAACAAPADSAAAARAKLLYATLLGLRNGIAAAEETAKELAAAPDARVAVPALLMLARIARDAGDLDLARARTAEAITREPASAAARLELKGLLARSGTFENVMIEIDPPPDPAIGDVPRDYREGVLALLRGDAAGAVAKLVDVTRRHPGWHQARMALGVAYYRANKREQAYAAFSQLAKDGGGTASVRVALAKLGLERGIYVQSVKDARQPATDIWGQSLRDSPRPIGSIWADAAGAARAALALEPGNLEALEILHAVSVLAGRLPDTVDAFGRRIAAARLDDPGLAELEKRYAAAAGDVYTDFSNADGLAMVYMAQHRLDEAEDVISRRMRSLQPTDPLIDYQLARLHLERGDHASARTQLNLAVERLEWLARNNYARKMRLDAARLTDDQLREARQAMPAIADVKVALGRIGLDQNDLEAARRHSREALEQNLSHASAAMQLSEAYLARARVILKDVPAARESWEGIVAGSAGVERRFALLTEWGDYLLGELTFTPPVADELNAAGAYAILTSVRKADAEFHEAARAVERVIATDPSNRSGCLRAAEVFGEWQASWLEAARTYESLADSIDALLQDSRKQLAALTAKIIDEKSKLPVPRVAPPPQMGPPPLTPEQQALADKVSRLQPLAVRLQSKVLNARSLAEMHEDAAKRAAAAAERMEESKTANTP